jgi:hypothetical protein
VKVVEIVSVLLCIAESKTANSVAGIEIFGQIIALLQEVRKI